MNEEMADMAKRRSIRRYGSRRYKKPLWEKCKDVFRTFIAFMFSNVGIIGLVVGYTVAGAFIFQFIESSYENEFQTNMQEIRNKTAKNIWNKIYVENLFNEKSIKNTVKIELKLFTDIITEAIRDGYDPDNQTYSEKWQFPGAFLYSLTVITTIGYGNVSPKTIWGKIVTIIYAIIGMPLFLLYLSNIGDILARCFKWLYSRCCLCQWCPNVARKREERRRTREVGLSMQDVSGSQMGSQVWKMRHLNPYIEGEDEGPFPSGASVQDGDGEDEDGSEAHTNVTFEEFDTQTVTVPITLCLTIMVGYICGGALLFSKYEGWMFLDGSYFCFISLSTIGFGDFVPGDGTYGLKDEKDEIPGLEKNKTNFAQIELSFVFCSMYLMLGMALIAMCFNLMQEEVINKIRRSIRAIKRIFR